MLVLQTAHVFAHGCGYVSEVVLRLSRAKTTKLRMSQMEMQYVCSDLSAAETCQRALSVSSLPEVHVLRDGGRPRAPGVPRARARLHRGRCSTEERKRKKKKRHTCILRDFSACTPVFFAMRDARAKRERERKIAKKSRKNREKSRKITKNRENHEKS